MVIGTILRSVDSSSFLLVVLASAFASLVATTLGPRVAVPVVVIELLLGIIIGPDVLSLAAPSDLIRFMGDLGLGLLFFFAGYEIDFARISGAPLRLGVAGWVLSMAIAYGLGGALAAAGIVLSLVYTGSAMATTAIGTLIPILDDAGEMSSRFGTYLLGAGAVGEFGPIVVITLALSSTDPFKSALILVAFVALSVVAALTAVRWVPLGWNALQRTLESSSQLAVRLAVVLVFALLTLASRLGLDVLLGGFAAGIIVRLALRGREVYIFESKLTAIGYGFLIPFFFIVSGMEFDLHALTATPSGPAKLVLFLALFLVVRGAPALLLYGRALPVRDRIALGFFSATQLPLVVAITTIALSAGKMRPSTASALVGAAMLSTLIFPLVGLRLRAGRRAGDVDDAAALDADADADVGAGGGEAAPTTA